IADTLEDRSIALRMRRRLKSEKVARFRHRLRFEEICGKCARFVADHADQIHDADPAVPDALNDRAADNWTPLLILADLAGGDWPTKARAAALELSGGDEIESLGTGGQLLADI